MKLVIGFLLGLCVMLAVGAGGSGENGRYECSASQRGLFVIDTRTGQTWKIEDASTTDFGTPTQRRSQQTYITPKG